MKKSKNGKPDTMGKNDYFEKLAPLQLELNDLALDAMVTGIHASLSEMLGDAPPPIARPDANFVLT